MPALWILAVKYVLRIGDQVWDPLDENEIVAMCKAGKAGRNALVAQCIALGLTHEAVSILHISTFKSAIEEKENQDKLEQARFDAEHSPDPLLTLRVRDTSTEATQNLTAIQIRNLFAHGKLSADAEFKHPAYSDWFPCRSLFRATGGALSSQRWEYFVLPLNVSGTTMGIISVFLDKKVSDESSAKLAKLGAEGWELVAVIPVTSGAIGASWSNSALAFLKRARA